MDWDLNGLRIFARIAHHQSFAKAAGAMGLTPSAVSKAMTRLERDLGVKLLHRNTRSVRLTADGEVFLDRCQHVLAEIDDAAAALVHARSIPQGRIRVLAPVGFGRQVVVPALLDFWQRYPEVSVDLELSDRPADVLLEGLDAIVTVGPTQDEALVSHRLGRYRMLACASADYLARRGCPQTPDDLLQHDCLSYAMPQTRRYREWVFIKDGRKQVVDLSGRININHAESLMAMALGGAGIVMLSTFVTAQAIQDGRLVPLLTDYMSPGAEIHIAYPPNRNLSARVRVFRDFMYQTLSLIHI